ncbi:MAG: 16S rRNA (uracil(1498)-N(3))-methyltransferase [Christensenellales bacterium]
MPRFFVQPENIEQGKCLLSPGDSMHARKVLRLKTGDTLTVCDGMGREYDALVEGETDGRLCLRLTAERTNQTEPAVRITLYQGVTKADKMELIIQKCVELGIFAIQPVLFERCVAKDQLKKLQRWNKISEQAAKQSGRGIIPQVKAPSSLAQVLPLMQSHDLLIVCYENEQSRSLKEVAQKGAQNIGIVIGPEGGLESGEVTDIEHVRGSTVTLGRRILRTETAGMAVLSILMFLMGEME